MKNYLFSLLLTLLAVITQAQTISIQGVLRDAKGRTVADGDYQVTFKLYMQLTGGTATFTESHPAVTTQQGLFAARLGAYQSLSSLAFNTTYYLGISIAGKAELEPRTELTLSPYAKSVRGGDNQFPSTGNVNIRTNLTIDLGNLYLAEGDVLLSKGSFTLDSGMITINFGDILLTDAGGAIRFADGTILNSAEGGTASSTGNLDTVNITGDADMDGAGGIEFQIGVKPVMTIGNNGFVTMEAGMKLDSGDILFKGKRDIKLGHYNATNKSLTTNLTLSPDSTATFRYTPQSLDTAEVADDAFTLGYLKDVIAEKLTQVEIGDDVLTIGDQAEGGLVFAIEGGYAYVAYFHNGYMEVSYQDFYNYSTWNSSAAFGAGYQNTQTLFSQHPNEAYTSVVEGFLLNNSLAGKNDWFLPSTEEVKRVLQVNPSFGQGYRIPTSTYSTSCSSSSMGYVEYVVNNATVGCENIEYTDASTYRFIFVRRFAYNPTSFDLSDPSDYVTAGVLQQNRSTFVDNSYKIGQVIGTGNDQGTVFARTADSVYIAKYVSGTYDQTYNTGFSWNSSVGFGAGYSNTQNMIAAAKAYSSLNSSEWSYQIENAHPNWYLPSVNELKAVLDSLPAGFAPSYTYLWTSSNYGTSTSNGYYVYTNGSGKYDSYSYTGRYSNYSAILIQKLPRTDLNTYSTNPSNLVTWAYYNAKMDELDRKLERAKASYIAAHTLPTYTIGQQTEGGTVFAVQGGYAYIAYQYSNSNSYPFYSYSSSATGTAIGTGYSNTQYILGAASTTSTSYIEGVLRSTVNGYNDWFMPSQDELQAVFDNSDVATNTYEYYWSSTYYGCCSYYYFNSPSYSTGYTGYNAYYFLILVRRVPTN